MVPEAQQRQIDDAFDRIEGTILPCIGMMLESLIEAAEAGRTEGQTHVHAAELRTLALQLEALTQEIEAVSPGRIDAGSFRSAAA